MEKLNWLGNKTKSLAVRMLDLYSPENIRRKGRWWALGLFTITTVVLLFALGVYWSQEPERFDVRQITAQAATDSQSNVVPGYTTTATLVRVVETLMDKPGGYLSNDRLPPSSLFGVVTLLDNIPNWEFGVLTMVRDTARVLRNDFSRSQSQSFENKYLAKAEPQFNFDNNSWLFPPTENEYRQGLDNLNEYLVNLSKQEDPNTQFFTRADNLNELLAVAEKRLGNLSQRLNSSVQELRINTDLAGDTAAQQATQASQFIIAKTPWLMIDDIFYESRGYVWALLHILNAIEVDFNSVLKKKNAVSSLQQVTRLLEQSLESPSSPVVLNGDPMGWVANYSKSMVSYISPANAAIIDLRNLLEDG